MRTLLNRSFGLFVCLLGLCIIALGLYQGLYVCFVGGWVDIIDQFKAPTTEASAVAWAFCKIAITSVVTIAGFIIGAIVTCFGGRAAFFS